MSHNSLRDTIAKEAAGKAAAELVEDGMLVGLGTGSTAAYFIKHLGIRCRNGLAINAVATSLMTSELAAKNGIPLIDIDSIARLDITVDGADEFDSRLRLIKGGGGALFREKIVAFMSHQMIVIADISKKVKHFGSFPLPVEIGRFAYAATLHHLKELGFEASLRASKEGGLYVTDNGNMIVDIKLKNPCMNPEKEDKKIKSIPGVIETGFFFDLADRVLIGFPDGHIEFLDAGKVEKDVI